MNIFTVSELKSGECIVIYLLVPEANVNSFAIMFLILMI